MTNERGGLGTDQGVMRFATTPGTSSFTEFVAAAAPDLLPRGAAVDSLAPHGTTIVAATYADGVIMAGDRRRNEAAREADG